ncbi:MAG TPA: DUF177 domain-containing protein [Chloroflexota bacterium]|nr:DUF177 domain-containing protein [Chloroflexota bacterium]
MSSGLVINVAQLLKADVGTARQYDVDESIGPLAENAEVTAPVRGTVRLMRTNRGILARANLETSVKLECSRCLEAFVKDLPIQFSEEFIPEIDVATGRPANVPHESYAFMIDVHHELNLEPAVREYGLIELPIAPICQDNCAGLCPVCGANRNTQTCECVVQATDERLAALSRFFAEDGDHEQ